MCDKTSKSWTEILQPRWKDTSSFCLYVSRSSLFLPALDDRMFMFILFRFLFFLFEAG